LKQSFVLAGTSVLLALSLACGRQSANPTSPSAAAASKQAATDAGTLKVTAPTLVSPINDEVLDGTATTLVAKAATGKYSSASLAYDFELYDANGVKVATDVVASTSWPVAGLQYDSPYTWRLRAASDGAFGPWSAFGPSRRRRTAAMSTATSCSTRSRTVNRCPSA
jgi:hypothetical protein